MASMEEQRRAQVRWGLGFSWLQNLGFERAMASVEEQRRAQVRWGLGCFGLRVEGFRGRQPRRRSSAGRKYAGLRPHATKTLKSPHGF